MCNSFHVSTLLDYSKAKNGDAVLIESGNRIANRRRDPNKKAGKLTQEQLAELLECSDRNVKKWENAKTPINSIKDLSALSEILECDIEYLTCQCDTLRKENQNAVELYGLSEHALDILHEMKEYDLAALLMIDALILERNLISSIAELWKSFHEKEVLKKYYKALAPEISMTLLRWIQIESPTEFPLDEESEWYLKEERKRKEFELYKSLVDFMEGKGS